MAPEYWSLATAALSASDHQMKCLIATYEGEILVSRGTPFATLARSIVGQQISVKASESIWARVLAKCGRATPEDFRVQGVAGLSDCGLSQRKIEYLLDLATHFQEGRLNPALWQTMDDETLIKALCEVRGIGRWTAEMFLIFNLLRQDVFPLDDIGLQRAVSRHYFSGNKLTRKELADFGLRWAPWRTVATWYLWRSLDPLPVAY
jgi:DNA-3-methyladenine glycosylase II